jgi:hypothetical protein
MAKLEFVEYTGSFPNLCSGMLFVKIDGKMVSFGQYCLEEKGETDDTDVPNYSDFWRTGGSVSFDEDWNEHVGKGPWEASWREEDYPPEIRELLPQLLELFNENVPYGCCGGCV